jgi:hypothetical protein
LTIGPDGSHIIPINTGSPLNFLNQQGTYSVPAGTGGATFEVNGTPLISTTPAVNFLNGTNVSISNPSAGNIQITATGGGSNWGVGKTLAMFGDSRFIVSSTYIVGANDSGIVTASTVSGSTITMTTTNTQTAANALILVSGFSACPALIGQTVIVSPTGLSGSSLQATNVSGVSSGSCGAGVFVGRDTTQYDMNSTSNIKGAVITNYAVGGGTAAALCPTISSHLPSVTPDGTHWVVIELGSLDANVIGTIESNLQTCWAGAHALGYKVIAETLIPIDYPFNIANPEAYQTQSTVSNWMLGQGPSSAHTVSGDGKYWDGLADAFSKFRDPRNATLIMQFGCSSPCEAQHLTAAGNLAQAGVIDMAAGNLLNPGYPQPEGQTNSYLADASGLSASSDFEYAGFDSSFGLDAVNYHIMTLGSGAGIQTFGINYGTLDNANLMAWFGPYSGVTSTTFGMTPPSGGLPTVGFTADGSLSNTMDVTIPGGATNTNGNVKMHNLTLTGTCTGCASSGVSSLNSLSGALNITAGSGVTVTPSGSNIQISTTAGSSSCTSHTISGAPPASYTFSGAAIPSSGYNDLTLTITGRVTGTGGVTDNIYLQLNGDTSTHYNWSVSLNASGSFYAGRTGAADTKAGFGVITNDSSPTGWSGSAKTTIHNYLDTTFANKTGEGLSNAPISGGDDPGFNGFTWVPSSPTAVTGVTVLVDSGATGLADGTLLTLCAVQ